MQKKSIPNLLTLLRAILTLIIIILFFTNLPNKFLWVYALFLIAGFSDFLDGYLARQWQVETTLGKVFDSLFDKILTLCLYMLLIPYGIIHSSIFIVLLFREILVDGIKNYSLSKNQPLSPLLTGKLKMTFQVLMLNFILLFLIFPETLLLKQAANLTALVAVFFAVISAFSYIKTFIKTY